jgi:hypothetical protein
MRKEIVHSMLDHILMDVENYWIKELNTEGTDFDFDSQDCFRAAYERCIIEWKLIEEYPPEVLGAERIDILTGLKETASELVKLYEKHKKFFRQYNREQLMLDTYRSRHPEYYSETNVMLKNYLGIDMEMPSREDYYKSPFYNQYGFLLNDYHFEIYVFCKYLLNEINNDFKNNIKFKSFIENSDYAPYFPMGLVYDVYKLCNENQFVKQTELEFYKSINLLGVLSNLEIVGSEIGRAYYVLHKFTNCIKDKEVRLYWINVILHRMGKDYEDNYLKRYRNVVSGDKLFVKEVDDIFKSYVIQ